MMDDKTLTEIFVICQPALDEDIMKIISEHCLRLENESKKVNFDPDMNMTEIIDILEKEICGSCGRVFKAIRNIYIS